MFLKSIEIRGFKSFADKTELTFKKGVTAVVGPNGSGKSNISDAVRWVLGEQSVKNLRGDKMEDVIFAGTQFRKPVGLAQVSLTLDNSDSELDIDYSHVTISRRLYRSGESEYLINNTSCRLKDVQQLFMDTGIGKEGYSIIGQGKIDAILSGRPEERRKLLEEAAGIVKFKTRKEEAEKRLDSTEQNLVRINDILATYEERLEPLRKESEKAKSFLKYSEELKTKEISIIVDFIDQVQEKIQKLNKESLKLNEEVEKITEEKNKFKENVERWNGELEIFENKKYEEKQLYYNSKSDYEKSLSEINILNERVENLIKFIDKTSSEIDTIYNKIKELKDHSEVLQKDILSSKNVQKEIKDKVELEEMKIKEIQENVAKENNQTKGLRNEEEKLSSNINGVKNDLIILNNSIDIANNRMDTLKNSIENYLNSIKINSNTKLILQDECEKIKEKIVTYENEIKENKREVNKIHTKLSLDEKTLKDCNFKMNRTEANLTLLTNLEKQYEGYNKSVKNLMQHVNEGKVGKADQCFVLGEIIRVEKSLEVSIEIALGGAISNIITENEIMAKTLINYLKQNHIGRATFLPLNIIKGKKLTIDNETKNNQGFIGIASELIDYDDKFNNIIDFILGKTLICKDMDSALEISKSNNFRYKIVTLSGDVVNPGGSLTGGSIYSKSSNIIGRKREIEELARDLERLKNEALVNTEKVKHSKAEILRIDEVNLNLRDEIHFENIEVTKIEGKINGIVSETIKLKNNLQDLNREILSEENRLVLSTTEIQEKSDLVHKFTLRKEEIQARLSEVESKLKDKIETIELIKEAIIEGKIKKAQIDEVIINKSSEFERLNREILEFNEKIQMLSSEIHESKETKNKSINIIKSTQEKVNEIMIQVEKMERIFEVNELERIKIKEKIKLNMNNLENASLILEKSEKELHKCELALTKVELEVDTHYQKLNEEFELTYAEALQFKKEIEDIDKLKKEIQTLKTSISSLGTVNVGSIEEYKEVTEKFTFMKDQKDDLVKAKDELLTVILEMTEKMRLVFSENFVILRQNFNETFKELFKGGSADLIIAEGDELTGKIDINVQPPGKKLQSISLMSGGEKVLSAIALLFAILKMKPTPFCILDEIEAALDDANVIRYAEFLKQFSNNIQFIVITHRKGTMEAGNVLYGVTMEEKGVSKIVSVDLNKAI